MQIEGDTALSGWPAEINNLFPTGEVVSAQVYSTERLRDLLTAILAAGAVTVKVEMREGLTALRLEANGEDGESVVGVLMPIKQAGEVGSDPNQDPHVVTGAVLHECAEKAAAECRAKGMDVEVEKP